jgi:hypothetical protein
MQEQHSTEPITETIREIYVIYIGWEEHNMVDCELDEHFVHKLHVVLAAAFKGLTISQNELRNKLLDKPYNNLNHQIFHEDYIQSYY